MPITRAQVPRIPAAHIRANVQFGALGGTCHYLGRFVMLQHSALWY
jgi:hypothetical protein